MMTTERIITNQNRLMSRLCVKRARRMTYWQWVQYKIWLRFSKQMSKWVEIPSPTSTRKD